MSQANYIAYSFGVEMKYTMPEVSGMDYLLCTAKCRLDFFDSKLVAKGDMPMFTS